MATTATKILYQRAATCPQQDGAKNLQYTLAQTVQMLITVAVVEAQNKLSLQTNTPGKPLLWERMILANEESDPERWRMANLDWMTTLWSPCNLSR